MQNYSKSRIPKRSQADTFSEIEKVSAAPYSSKTKFSSFYLPTFLALQQKQGKNSKVSARANSSKTEKSKFNPPARSLLQQSQRQSHCMNTDFH